MQPVQPYFALSSSHYYKRPVLAGGISHLYEYRFDESLSRSTIAVPDGCVDLVIDLDSPDLAGYAAGTVLRGSGITNVQGHHYFGIRFLPGVLPGLLDGQLQDFVDTRVDLSLCSPVAGELRDRVFASPTSAGRADRVQEFLLSQGSGQVQLSESKLTLARTVRDLLQSSGGRMSVHELEEETLYSARYIRKVFQEAFGLSPKTFAQIVQFQLTIDRLDHDTATPLGVLAAESGYYDQSRFIHAFRQYTGCTPQSYRRQIIESNYEDKFILL